MTRQEVQGMSPFTSTAGRAKLLAKNRQTFILQTTKLTRIARRVCQDILQPRRAARRPYASINANAVKAECEYGSRTTGEGGQWGAPRGFGITSLNRARESPTFGQQQNREKGLQCCNVKHAEAQWCPFSLWG